MTIELALQLVIVPGIPASFDYEHEQTEGDLQKKICAIVAGSRRDFRFRR